MTPRQGEVYLVPYAPGRHGKPGEETPFIVISPNESNELGRPITVAPFTTMEHPSRFRVPCRFEGGDGHAVLDEMADVAAESLGRRLGALDPKSLATVLGGLRELFGD